jgi:hypothetical protein
MKQSLLQNLAVSMAVNRGDGVALFSVEECWAWRKKFSRMSFDDAKKLRDELVSNRKGMASGEVPSFACDLGKR